MSRNNSYQELLIVVRESIQRSIGLYKMNASSGQSQDPKDPLDPPPHNTGSCDISKEVIIIFRPKLLKGVILV